jgi:hypothetical protein
VSEEATEILLEESAAPSGKRLQTLRSIFKGKESLVIRAFTAKGQPVSVRITPPHYAQLRRALAALVAAPVEVEDGGTVVFSRGPQTGKVSP